MQRVAKERYLFRRENGDRGLERARMILQKASYLKGLRPPDHEASCGCIDCKRVKPSTIELELASRPHRWTKMREIQKKLFQAIADQITKHEIDVLKLLKLPNIDAIREDYLSDETDPGPGRFEFTKRQKDGYRRIIKDLRDSLLGEDFKLKGIAGEKKQLTELSPILFWLFAAFSATMTLTEEHIREQLEKMGMTAEQIASILAAIAPRLENQYLQAVIQDAGKRIVTELGINYMDVVINALTNMAKEGKSPLEAGRYLHNFIGEGKLWYWNRIARSESVLAINAAFDYQADQIGAKYEEWSAGAGACPICAAFDGNMWPIHSGPKPVESTHPHCLCTRVMYYTDQGKPVRPTWTRPSPYDERYTPDEIARLNDLITYGEGYTPGSLVGNG